MRSRRLGGDTSEREDRDRHRPYCSGVPTRVTLRAINDDLALRGHNARLEKTSDYFCFFGGEATDWIDRTVAEATLNSRTLDQWVAEFVRLKKLNAEIVRTARAGGKAMPERGPRS
jgi:hypothetical protein